MLQPVNNRVVIEIVEKSSTTSSGIALAGMVDAGLVMLGRVVAVGDVKSVKVGDEVYVRKYGWDLIEEDDKKYFVGEEIDILAIKK